MPLSTTCKRLYILRKILRLGDLQKMSPNGICTEQPQCIYSFAYTDLTLTNIRPERIYLQRLQ